RNRRVVEDIPVDAIISRAHFLATDPQDGVWIGGGLGEFAHIRQGKADVVVRVESPEGAVAGFSLSVDADGRVRVATNRGLYRWQAGRLSHLDRRNGLPCPGIYSATKDDSGAFWLYARCGLLRIAASDWAAWLASPDRRISVDLFDVQDGLKHGTGVMNQP